MAASPVDVSKGWKQQAKMDSFGLGLILNKVTHCAVACHLSDVVHWRFGNAVLAKMQCLFSSQSPSDCAYSSMSLASCHTITQMYTQLQCTEPHV